MANAASVWGIEIGQSALKAMLCRLEGDQVVAEAFDYIEYPKILSQPESNTEELIREALETFANRNDLRKKRVALSVPGSSGLAKFFKPPPVELKKLPDIVKYEARQQIPFELEDVIWDYQLMSGGDISEGFALESEVGLFAMKRDSVYRALKPLEEADIEIDLLQLAPLSIYNAVTYDKSLAADEDFKYDSEHPPKYTVVLAMGTDSTDLIVTNGYRVWQRSMPLGGNHFTRQLTKELKLTHAKAEHLKRNAMEADDPKLVFQAMRPVFNDLVTEVQRSMGFFNSLNKNAEIGSILMLGNSVKLPGLSQFLSKNLAMDVEVLDDFKMLSGDDVKTAPAFKDHVASFSPVFGLCLQSLGKGPVATNLIPKEVVTDRLIRSKKPWAIAAAAVLLLGFAGNLMFAGSRYGYVHEDRWEDAMSKASSTKSASDTAISSDNAKMQTVKLLKQIGDDVSGSGDRRLLWMEVLHALFKSLNRPPDFDLANPPNPEETPYSEWPILFVTKMDCKQFDDVTTFLTDRIIKQYVDDNKTWRLRVGDLALEGPVSDETAGAEDADADAAAEEEEEEITSETLLGPPDEDSDSETPNKAWVIQIDGYHYHNGEQYAATGDELEEFVLKTLVRELETGSISLPIGNGQFEEFTYKQLGLMVPFVIPGGYDEENKIPNPEYVKKYGRAAGGMYGGGGPGGMGPGGMGPGSGGPGGMGPGGMGPGGGGSGGYGGYGGYGGGAGPGGAASGDEEEMPQYFDAPKYSFKLQVIWKETPLTKRLEAKRKAEQEAAEEAALAAEDDENLANL